MTDGLQALAARIQRLEDERDVIETLHRYAHAHASGDREAFLDCFTEDAYIQHSRHGLIEGHAGLGTLFDGIPHKATDHHKWVLVEPLVTLDGDRASVSADYLYVQSGDDGPRITTFGHYEDELARGSDGRWRLTCRRIRTEAGLPVRA